MSDPTLDAPEVAAAGTDAVPSDTSAAPNTSAPPTADAANAATTDASGTSAPPPAPNGDSGTPPATADAAPGSAADAAAAAMANTPADTTASNDAKPDASTKPKLKHHKRKHRSLSAEVKKEEPAPEATSLTDNSVPPPSNDGPAPAAQPSETVADANGMAQPNAVPPPPAPQAMTPPPQPQAMTPPPPPPPIQQHVTPPPPPPAQVEADEPFYMKKSVLGATAILVLAGVGSLMFRRKE